MFSRYIVRVESIQCPVCGRIHNYTPLENYWCPYCGGTASNSNDVSDYLEVMNRRIVKLEKAVSELQEKIIVEEEEEDEI